MAYYESRPERAQGRQTSSRSPKNPPPPGGFQQFQPAKQDPDKDKKMIRGMCFKVAGMAWANQYKHKSFELPHEVMVKDVISLAKKYEKAYNEWMEE